MTITPSLTTSTREAFIAKSGIPNKETATVFIYDDKFTVTVGQKEYVAIHRADGQLISPRFTCPSEHNRPLTLAEATDLIWAIKRSMSRVEFMPHKKLVTYLQDNLPAATSCPETPRYVEASAPQKARHGWTWSLANQ